MSLPRMCGDRPYSPFSKLWNDSFTPHARDRPVEGRDIRSSSSLPRNEIDRKRESCYLGN